MRVEFGLFVKPDDFVYIYLVRFGATPNSTRYFVFP